MIPACCDNVARAKRPDTGAQEIHQLTGSPHSFDRIWMSGPLLVRS
jgi:hypothetical protein